MRKKRIEATERHRKTAHAKVVLAREQAKRNIAIETKKEFLERYNTYHGNMLTAQHRMMESIGNPKRKMTAQEAKKLERLVHEGFKINTFFKGAMEVWRGQQHNLGAFMIELANKLSGKRIKPGVESPSFKQRRAVFRQKMGWQFRLGGWKGLFEEAYLRVNLEANGMASAEYAKVFDANASAGENIRRIQQAQINLGEIELSAVSKVFGKQALAKFREWKEGKPQGTISDFLLDVATGMH